MKVDIIYFIFCSQSDFITNVLTQQKFTAEKEKKYGQNIFSKKYDQFQNESISHAQMLQIRIVLPLIHLCGNLLI